jgi:hypothetical protein
MLTVGDTLCQLLSTWKTPFLVLGCELRPDFTALRMSLLMQVTSSVKRKKLTTS